MSIPEVLPSMVSGVRAAACSAFAAIVLSLSPAHAEAAIIDSGLTGTTSYNGWEALNNSYYNVANHGVGYPGLSPWLAPMVANEAGSNDGEFTKTAGSGYAATASVYSPSGGEYSVSDPTVLADLETVVFAISIAPGNEPAILDGPTLIVNGSTFGAADNDWDLGSQTSTIGGFEVTQTTYAYQWDLSAFGSAITSFDIQYEVNDHAQTYALQLEQSDAYSLISPVAVPEPSTFVLAGMALAALVLRFRRRIR